MVKELDDIEAISQQISQHAEVRSQLVMPSSLQKFLLPYHRSRKPQTLPRNLRFSKLLKI